MGTYYVTSLETGDRRLVQREVPFLFDDEYDTGVKDEDDKMCIRDRSRNSFQLSF